MSEAKVSQLVAEGVIERGHTPHTWLLAYCERLRKVAAGRASGEAGGLDLSHTDAQASDLDIFAPIAWTDHELADPERSHGHH